MIGYIGRINQTEKEQHRGLATTTGQLPGHRLHRQARHRAELRERAARHDRLRGGRDRRRRPRRAHADEQRRRRPATTSCCRSTSSCRQLVEAAVRRPARRAGRDRSAQRRGARLRQQARLRSQPVRRRHRRRELAGAERIARQAAAQPARCAAPIRRARPTSRSWRWRRSTLGKRTPQQTIFDPGFFSFGNHRFRDDKEGGHGTVDMYKSIVAVLRHLLLHARQRPRRRRRSHDFMAPLGFGQLTGIDIEGELRGMLPSTEWKRKRLPASPKQQKWYAGETISLGIGQGYNASRMLQLAQADGDRRRRRRSASRRTWCATIENVRHARARDGRARAAAAAATASPSTSRSSATRSSA